MRISRQPSPIAALLVAVSMLTAAGCGSRLDRQELLDANVVNVELGGGAPASAAGRPGATPGLGDAVTGQQGSASADGVAAGPDPSGSAAGPAGSDGGQGASGAAVGTPGETGPIVIGSVGNYSGPAGTAATGMPKAVQVWVSAVNEAGGLFGREVQAIVVDDQGDPAQHLSAIKDLVENRGVVAFVGNYAPLTAPAATSYLESKGVPVIGEDCGIKLYEQNPAVYFSECGPAFGVTANGVHAAVSRGLGTKLAILFCGEAQICRDGDAAAGADAPKVGAQVVYRSQISLVQPDFTSECINARDAGADLMFVISDPNGIARVAESCARQGYRPQQVTGGNVSGDAPSRTGLETILAAVPTFPFEGSPSVAAQQFYDAWDAFGSGARGPAASQGWASAKIFELAANRAAQASQSVSPATLVAALRTIKDDDLQGLTPTLDFSDAFANRNCYWTMQGSDGRWRALDDGAPTCR